MKIHSVEKSHRKTISVPIKSRKKLEYSLDCNYRSRRSTWYR